MQMRCEILHFHATKILEFVTSLVFWLAVKYEASFGMFWKLAVAKHLILNIHIFDNLSGKDVKKFIRSYD